MRKVLTLVFITLLSVAMASDAAACGRMKGKTCSMRANAGNCCAAMKDVKRQVKNTANGAIITLTSNNPKSVKALQARIASCGKMGGKTCPRRTNAGGCTRKTAVPKT